MRFEFNIIAVISTCLRREMMIVSNYSEITPNNHAYSYLILENEHFVRKLFALISAKLVIAQLQSYAA